MLGKWNRERSNQNVERRMTGSNECDRLTHDRRYQLGRLIGNSVVWVSLLSCLGCAQHPKVDVVPRILENDVVFDISTSGINGILGFRINDSSGSLIWAITLDGQIINRIQYGVLRTGELAEARQTFPPDRKAPVDIRGKSVVVSIHYQYDAYAARAGTIEKTVAIP
jgi:hypothetical protein